MAKQDDYIKTALRIPRALHAQLTDSAEQKGCSLNAEFVARLQSSGSSAEDLDTIRSQALHMATYEYELLLNKSEIATLKARLALLARYLIQSPAADNAVVRGVIDEYIDYQAPMSQVEEWQAQISKKVSAMRLALDRLDEVRPPPPEEK